MPPWYGFRGISRIIFWEIFGETFDKRKSWEISENVEKVSEASFWGKRAKLVDNSTGGVFD